MSKMSLKKKKVPYGLFMPPEMLIWLSLLFNQKPLGPNDLSQKKNLRSILENSIFSEKPLNSSHLLSKSFNLKILVEIPRLIKMIQQEQDSVTMDKGCRSYWERKNQSQTFTTFFFTIRERCLGAWMEINGICYLTDQETREFLCQSFWNMEDHWL